MISSLWGAASVTTEVFKNYSFPVLRKRRLIKPLHDPEMTVWLVVGIGGFGNLHTRNICLR